MKVRSVMHKGVTCVQPDTPVREIAKRMRKYDIGAIPVRADDAIVGDGHRSRHRLPGAG
jgi:CBS domain-containing protein